MCSKEVELIQISTNPDANEVPTFEIPLKVINQKKGIRLEYIKVFCNPAAIGLERSSTVENRTIRTM